MFRRSSAFRSFEVACRAKAVTTWSAGMPEPLSVTRMSLVPPWAMETEMRVAPASRAFSTSSLTTEAGSFDDFAGRDLRGDRWS